MLNIKIHLMHTPREHAQWQVSEGNGIHDRGSKNEAAAVEDTHKSEDDGITSVFRDLPVCESSQLTNR